MTIKDVGSAICASVLLSVVYLVILVCQTNPRIKRNRFTHRKIKSEPGKKHTDHCLRTTKVNGVRRASIKDVQTGLFWGLIIIFMIIFIVLSVRRERFM